MVSPNAQPQNGITEAQLLQAAGYGPESQTSASAPEAPAAHEGSTFLEEVQQYCAADINRISAAAQCMVGELIKKNASPKLTLHVENSWVAISEELPDSESPLLHICIPAFVPEEHLIPFAVSAALLQFGEAKRRYKDSTVRFHILTDSASLCNFLSASFHSETNLEILLTKDLSAVYRRYSLNASGED